MINVQQTSSKEQCQAICQDNPYCIFAVRLNTYDGKVGECYLKDLPVTGSSGYNAPRSNVDTTCWLRPNDGNYFCIANWDVMGDHYNGDASCGVFTLTEAECRAACDQSSKCKFYLYFRDGLCALKQNAFHGNCGATESNTYVSRACFQVL